MMDGQWSMWYPFRRFDWTDVPMTDDRWRTKGWPITNDVIQIEVVEEEEEEEVEEYEEYVVDGKTYYIQNKNHGSFIYKDGETEDEIGEEVGVFCNGIARFFQQFID